MSYPYLLDVIPALHCLFGMHSQAVIPVLSLHIKPRKVFIRASDLVEMGERDFSIIQRYVILMYDTTSGIEDVNDCRRYLFTKNGK